MAGTALLFNSGCISTTALLLSSGGSKDRFNITYDLNGQKRLDQYHLGFAGDQCKLAEQYIINEEGRKIKIKQ